MGISMSGGDAFTYNRFDALDEAYAMMYEAKECDEDGVSDDEEDAIKDAVKKHNKSKHSEEDEDDEEETDEDESEEDDDEEGEEKKDPKKMLSLLKKGKVEESVISYLIDEGFTNNEVSAEVMLQHMSEEWFDAIIDEAYKKFPYKKVEDKIHKKEAASPNGRGTKDTLHMGKVYRDFKGETRRTEKKEFGAKLSKSKSAQNKFGS